MKHHAQSPAFRLLLAIVFLYTLFSLTGRYDAPVGLDEVRDVGNAWELVHEGTMPRHGAVSGLFALSTPGISFAYVPGVILAPGNPSAAERIGAAVLFFGTLLGLYLWLEGRLGQWATAFSLMIFSVGSAGAFFAVSLWPRAHPFFFVWMLYFLTLWIERKDARFLAAALFVYAAGLYWFLEFAPAIFVVPVLQILYRPPVKWRWILGAGAASLLLFSPYLVFEAGRGFTDLRHLLLQKTVMDLPPVSSQFYQEENRLVDATYAREVRENGAQGAELKADSNLADCDRWFETPEWGTVWFQAKERTFLGEPGYVFYSEILGGWSFQSVTTGRLLLQGRTEFEKEAHAVPFPTTRPAPEIGGLRFLKLRKEALSFAPTASLAAGDFFILFLWHVALLVAALVFAFWKCGFGRRSCADASTERGAVAWRVIFVGAVIPALVLTLASRADSLLEGERHFRWLWVAYAAALGGAAGTVRIGRWKVGAALGFILIATLYFNPVTQGLFRDAFRGIGEKGKYEAALDTLAETIRQDGVKEVRIGYDMNLYSWQIDTRLADGRSKSFEELDQVLLMRHGIRNLDTSAEGISPGDDYVLRSTNYGFVGAKNSVAPKRWSMTLDGSLPQLEVVATTGEFEICRVIKPE